MIIDAHAHYTSPEVFTVLEREPEAHGVELQKDAEGRQTIVFETGLALRPMSLFPRMFDLDAQLAEMDENGIKMRVQSTWLDLVAYWLPLEKAARLNRLQNETMAQALSSHSTRFVGLATVPLQDGKTAADELRYAMETLGLRGAMIGSHANEANFDEPFLEPFWEAAEALEAFILLHPFQIFAGERYSRYYLHNIVGNPLETTLAASSLIFGGVLARYPGLRICLSHGGGFLPYQISRLDRAFEALPLARERLDTPPGEFLRSFYYDSITFDTTSLTFLIERVGAENVLLGSDFPFGMGDPNYRKHVDALGPLTSEAREAIMGGTAARLLQINKT